MEGVLFSNQRPPSLPFHHLIVALLLWKNALPSKIDLILKTISELQLVAIFITFASDQFNNKTSDWISSTLNDLSSYVSFRFEYDISGGDPFTIAVFGMIVIYLLIITLLTISLFILYHIGPVEESCFAKAWSYIGQFHHTLIFLFIHQFTLTVLKNIKQKDLFFASKIGNEGVVMSVMIIITILNAIFSLFTARFAYYPMRSDYLTAVRSPGFQFLGLLFKLIEPVIGTFSTSSTITLWLSLGISVLFLTVRVIRFMRNFPFYHYGTTLLFLTLALVQQSQIMLNIIWALINLKRETSFQLVLGSQIIFAVVFSQISRIYLWRSVWTYGAKENKHLKTESEFYKKLFAIDKALKSGSIRYCIPQNRRPNEYEIPFINIIVSHAESCTDSSCSCKFFLLYRAKDAEQQSRIQDITNPGINGEKLYFKCISEFYQEGMKFMHTNPFIKLQLSYFLIENDDTAFPSAIHLTTSIKTEIQRLEVRLIKSELVRHIESKMRSTLFLQKTRLNVKQIIDYYLLKQKMRIAMINNTKLFSDFWETYQFPTPSMIKLFELSRLINIDAEKVTALAQDLITRFPKFCLKDYIIIALHMRLIRSAPFTAEKMFSKYFAMNGLRLAARNQAARDGKEYFEDDNILVCFSLNQTNFANITFVSQNIEELGYTMKGLSGHSIGILMPTFFAKKHQNFIQSNILKGSTHIINKDLPVFVRLCNGHIHPAMVYVMPFPYLQHGFYFLAILKLTKSSNENYLLMLPDGKIDCVSEKFAETLKIDLNKIDSYYIDDICLDSLKVMKYVTNTTPNSGKKGPIQPTHELPKHHRKSSMMTSDHDLLQPDSLSPALSIPSPFTPNGPSQKRKSLLPNFAKKIQSIFLEEESDKVQPFLEEFNKKGVVLRFVPYTGRKAHFSKYPTSFKVLMTKISFQGDDLYSLKAFKVEEVTETIMTAIQNKTIKEESRASLNFNESITGEPENDLSPVPKERSGIFSPLFRRKSGEDPQADVDMMRKKMSQNLDDKPKVILLESKELEKDQPKPRSGQRIKTIVKDDIKKQIYKDVDPVLDADASSTRMGTKGLLTLSKIEQAIYYKEGVSSYYTVKFAVVSFILMSIGMFVYYQVAGHENFNSLKLNVDILSLSIKRLFGIVESNRRSTIIKLIESGLLPRERHSFSDFSAILVSDYISVSGDLSEVNNKMRETVYKFNSNQLNKFYELLPIYQVDNSSNLNYGNAFDLCSQLASAGFRLYAALPATPTPDNPDVNFIIQNTLNEIVIHSEGIFGLLMDEDNSIIIGMKNMQLSLLVISVIAGILIILILIRSEVVFYHKKMMFFDCFLRIDEYEVSQTIAKTQTLLELLKDINNSEEDIMNSIQEFEDSQTRPQVVKPDAKKNNNVNSLWVKKKKGDFTKINKASWIGVLSLTAFIMSFWVVYTAIYVFFIERENATSSLKWQIIQTDMFLARLSQAITTLYIYIGGNDAKRTVRGRPLETEWETNFGLLIKSSQFFGDLKDKDFGVYTDEVRALISGDICKIKGSDDTCYEDGEGSKTRGIVGVTNYYLQTIHILKDTYDESDKTLATKRRIYARDDYAELERVYFDSLIASYNLFEAVSRKIFLAAIDAFETDILIINIISLIVFMINGRLYWTTGLRKMQMEKVHFREIMKVIPVSVIMQNKFLQSYLKNNSKKILKT